MLKVDEFSVEVCTRTTIYVNAVCFVIAAAAKFFPKFNFLSCFWFSFVSFRLVDFTIKISIAY